MVKTQYQDLLDRILCREFIFNYFVAKIVGKNEKNVVELFNENSEFGRRKGSGKV